MRLATLLTLFAGIILFSVILFRYGVGPIASAVVAAGWGLLWVSLFRFVTITTDAAGWRALFAEPLRPALGPLVRTRWIGDSINSLLPVAQIGGDVARARLATRLGVSGTHAGATVMVDFTLGLGTQLLYTLIGLGFLIQVAGKEQGRALVGALYWGLLAAALAITAFYAVQRGDLFQKLAPVIRVVGRGRVWSSLASDATELDRNIADIYRRRGDVLTSALWRMATWLLHTGETWLALYFLGAPVSLEKALVLESLGTAVRSVAFAVPGGVGVQEGGFVLLGSLVGLRPELSLALALVKRVRELLVGGPGLVAWTTAEGRNLARLFSRRP